MGYLPGYATPQIVCDVSYVGKRWMHHYYDPIFTLGEAGQKWWSGQS